VKHRYEIPSVRIRSPRAIWWVPGVSLFVAIVIARHVWYIAMWGNYRLIAAVWGISSLFAAVQWTLSWLERPYTVALAQQKSLDRMKVTVNVPVYNEDPTVLDRVLYALFWQSRLPDRVEVVDDGSNVDYTWVRAYWERQHPPGITFSWVRQANRGKKCAQCVTFARDNADIFITLDSDTTLEREAIAEGLKPFADHRVQSVAGLELAWNHDRNLLTRIKSVNTVIWQFITCSAQNTAAGNNLVNRGTFALYRAPVIRDNVDAYLGETLFGRPVRLGDDSMLTLFALGRGRAVQQTTAVSFAMYPETFSHTFRQWTRWMRGTSVRTMWRLRYLPLASWGWWYNFLTTWWYLAFLGVLGSAVMGFGSSWRFLLTAMVFSAGWVWVMAIRMFMLRRSDQSALQVAEAFALVPLAIAWMAFVLRPIRLYGNLTMLRQGWVTRVHGAEAMAPAEGMTREAAAYELEGVQ
jgi:hyaluronan synthase